MANAKKPAARKKAAAKKTPVQVDRGSCQTTNDQSETDEVTTLTVEEYKPSHPVLENAGLDQHAAEADRQAERQAERDEHNLRTAGFKY